MTPRYHRLAIGLVLLSTVACSALSPGPAATVSRFYRHLEKGEIEDAQKLLSSKLVGRLGADKLRSGLGAAAGEISGKQGIRNLEVQKEEVQGELATVTVLIAFGDGSTKTDNSKLVKEQGAWKLDASK
jgi:Domain of unknown function (DUF4878)